MKSDTDNTTLTDSRPYLDDVAWDKRGLVPVIAQDAGSGAVLMLAWMNREALAATLDSHCATYWSRSRGKLWRKGEESGHVQHVVDIRLDCDNDAVLLRVTQAGGIACHTGRASCFYKALTTSAGESGWTARDPVLKAPDEIYG